MGKTNFQSLKELTTALSEKLDKLASGKLKLDEIEKITDQARELYERLVVIRYKSYETMDVASNKVVPAIEPEAAAPIIETTNTDSDEEELMMFDFTTEELVADGHTENKVQKEEPNKVESEKKTVAENGNKDNSLNDNFKKKDGSFARKFQKAPIEDLKEHIGINRKFLYVNDLFKGDSNAYNLAIGLLNSCSSKTEAFKHVDQIKLEQSWDIENPTVIGFIELVERRYIG